MSELETNTKQNGKVSLRQKTVAIFFITLVFILFVIMSYFIFTNLTADKEHQHKQIVALEKERDHHLVNIAALSRKNRDDLQAYITHRYTSVPVELAEVIAYETDNLSKVHNIDFNLVAGLMEVESGFNPFAKSKVGARGLLQVMHRTWGKTYNIKNSSDLHDIHFGLETGIQVFKHYLSKNKGNVTQALQNYNGAKGRDFSNSVYIAVGKFSAFRNNTYQIEKKGDIKNGTKGKNS